MRTLSIALASLIVGLATAVAQAQTPTESGASNGCRYLGNPGQYLARGSNICVKMALYRHSEPYWELMEFGTNHVTPQVEPYVWKDLGKVDPSKAVCTYHYPSQY